MEQVRSQMVRPISATNGLTSGSSGRLPCHAGLVSETLTEPADRTPEAETPVPGAEAGLRAYEIVLRWVDDRILGGSLRVGDLLPPERELARMLDVSRAAVREAVRTLQARGVVRSSVGAGAAGGTRITAVPSDALSRLLQQHVALANFPLDDVIEVRVTLERLSVRLAASHASTEDLAGLRALLDTMDDPDIDRVRFNDCDTAFHVALAAAAGNLLARDLTAAIRESMRLPILDRLRALDSWEAVCPILRRDHEGIYAAVARGDGAAAAALAEEHIRSAWHLLSATSEG